MSDDGLWQGKKRVRDEKSLQLVAKLMSLLLQIRVNYSAVQIVFFSFRIESNCYRRSQKSPVVSNG